MDSSLQRIGYTYLMGITYYKAFRWVYIYSKFQLQSFIKILKFIIMKILKNTEEFQISVLEYFKILRL